MSKKTGGHSNLIFIALSLFEFAYFASLVSQRLVK
jgi:hypothetical protein